MPQKAGNVYPDGLVRIDYKDMYWDFAIQAKARVTRAIVAMEKAQPTLPWQDRILVTEYATPQMADLMKKIGLLFMDTAGNAYINKPPLYVFIKGNKRPENLKPAPTKRLFKPAGLKVVFALLNHPEMVEWPYRQIADRTDVALGTVDWIFRDLKEMGFLLELGKRNRKITNPLTLLKNGWRRTRSNCAPSLALRVSRQMFPTGGRMSILPVTTLAGAEKLRPPSSPGN